MANRLIDMHNRWQMLETLPWPSQYSMLVFIGQDGDDLWATLEWYFHGVVTVCVASWVVEKQSPKPVCFAGLAIRRDGQQQNALQAMRISSEKMRALIWSELVAGRIYHAVRRELYRMQAEDIYPERLPGTIGYHEILWPAKEKPYALRWYSSPGRPGMTTCIVTGITEAGLTGSFGVTLKHPRDAWDNVEAWRASLRDALAVGSPKEYVVFAPHHAELYHDVWRMWMKSDVANQHVNPFAELVGGNDGRSFN